MRLTTLLKYPSPEGANWFTVITITVEVLPYEFLATMWYGIAFWIIVGVPLITHVLLMLSPVGRVGIDLQDAILPE